MGTLSIYIKFHLEEGTGFVFLFASNWNVCDICLKFSSRI